ncbi:MAG: TrkH family potassium uptake protein [Actinobacteria bacterium]|nr:TrkH family potassium uptake protein [Actinomycetota bacterium]
MSSRFAKQWKSIIYYSGKIIFAFSFTLIVPLITAAIFSEWNMFFSFLLAISISLIISFASEGLFKTEKELNWLNGMLVVVITWAVVNSISAIPCFQSGFYGSYLDAFFDSMSGYTTTGLTLIQDLDHSPYSLLMWRHFMQYIGGQGIIVLALTFLSRSLRGAIKTYIGEAKDERLWPNIKSTALSIWRIANMYLLVGTLIISGFLISIGVKPVKAILHGIWIMMASWSTGGFAPSSLSLLAYHNFLLEIAVVVFMFLGSMNFAVHFLAWKGKIQELFKNIEVRTFAFYFLLTFAISLVGLISSNTYSTSLTRFRFSLLQISSAVTTTGFSNIPTQVMFGTWNELAILGVSLAMALGASACSTAGGIKAIRIALDLKGIYHEVRRIINPESSIIYTYYHHIRQQAITDNQVKMAGLITLSYIALYFIGALVGIYYGYPFIASLYESISATANVGLSSGITSPSMPALLKVVFILQMWLGRLEFTALLALFGYLLIILRRR